MNQLKSIQDFFDIEYEPSNPHDLEVFGSDIEDREGVRSKKCICKTCGWDAVKEIGGFRSHSSIMYAVNSNLEDHIKLHTLQSNLK